MIHQSDFNNPLVEIEHFSSAILQQRGGKLLASVASSGSLKAVNVLMWIELHIWRPEVHWCGSFLKARTYFGVTMLHCYMSMVTTTLGSLLMLSIRYSHFRRSRSIRYTRCTFATLPTSTLVLRYKGRGRLQAIFKLETMVLPLLLFSPLHSIVK